MIVLKSQEISSINQDEQDRIAKIVAQFCEENEHVLCMMTTKKIENKLLKLVKENADKSIVYINCIAFVASHNGQYLHDRISVALEDCMFVDRGLLTITDKKAKIYDIAIFFRYEKDRNNSFIECLVKLDTSFKKALR